MDKTYTISILMTRHKDILSKAMYYFIGGGGYSHVSIGIDESEDAYYSFNIKGFRKEHPKRHRDQIKKSICYKLSVTKKEHKKIVELINEFQKNHSVWKYSLSGVILCRMRIPHKMKRRYFCSQFVTEILQKAEVIKTRQSASLYLPKILEKELSLHLNLREIIPNPV